MAKKYFTVLLVISNIFFIAPAYAEGEKLKDKLAKGTITLSAEVKGCDADLIKYCSGLDPDSQKAFLCMMAYEEKLSASCKMGIMEAAMSARMGAAAINYSAQACEADADKFCLDVKPGEGRLIRCIREHEPKVSEGCVSVLKETGLWEMGAR